MFYRINLKMKKKKVSQVPRKTKTLGWTLSASRKGSVSPELNLGAQLLPQSQKVVLHIFVLCEKGG